MAKPGAIPVVPTVTPEQARSCVPTWEQLLAETFVGSSVMLAACISEHRPPRRAQRSHQQPPRGLDRDRDRIIEAVASSGEHLGQHSESGRVITDALLGDQFSLTIDDRNIVMAFSPVDSAKAIQSSTFPRVECFRLVRYPGENAQRPTYEPLGLASDELFAISAHPHGAGLGQSSSAPDKIEASGRAGRLKPRAIPPVCTCPNDTTRRARCPAVPSDIQVSAQHQGSSHHSG